MKISQLTIDMAANVARLSQDMERARRVVDQSMGGISRAAGAAQVALGGLGVGFSLGSVITSLVTVQREFDKLNSSLMTVTGGSASASQAFDWLSDFAATTPYQLNEVVQAFNKMKALGLDASEESLRSYGNTAAAMGKDLNQMIEAIADAATGEFERLKEFGIRAKSEGDKVVFTFRGVSTEVSKSADEITQYLRRIGETDFAGAMDLRAQTLDGAISNLSDSFSRLLLTVSQGGIGDALRSDAQTVSANLSIITEKMQEAERSGGGAVRQLADGIGTALGRATFGFLSDTVSLVNQGVNVFTGGIYRFNEAVDLMPDNLRASSEQLAIIRRDLEEARVRYDQLSERLKQAPDNIYLKSEMGNLSRYIASLREAQAEKLKLEGKFAGGGRGMVNPQTVGEINAQEERKRQKQEEAQSAIRKKYATDAQKLNEELKAARDAFGGMIPADLEQQIRARFTKPAREASAAAREVVNEQKAQAAVYASVLGVNADYLESLQRIQVMRESGRLTDEQSIVALERLIGLQPVASQQMQDMSKWAEQSRSDNERFFDDQLKRVESLQGEVRAQQQANEAIGLSGAALAQLEAARQRDAAAELDRLAAIQQGIDPAIAKLYQDQAKALRDLADARVDGAIRQEAVDAAKKAQDEWQKTSDSIERSLTDALMRGFESGKGFGENLGDTIGNYFKTTVARIIAQAITQAIMAALASTQWGRFLSGVMGGGGSGGGIAGNLISNAGSSAMGSFASSAVGNYLGAGNTGALVGGATGAMSWGNVAGSIAANGAVGAGGAAAGGSIAADGLGTLLASNGAYGTAAGGAAATSAGGSALSGAASVLGNIPVWGWVAIAAIALWQPLFGRKLKEAGTQLKFDGAGGVTANEYKFYKGGLFRSDKTQIGADITGQSTELIQMARNAQEGAAAMARALGFSDAAIKSYTGSLKINFKGAKTAEEQMKRVNDAMTEMQRQMMNAATGMNFTKQQFADFMKQIQESMQSVGITADGMSSVITQGLMGKMSGTDVGAALADMVVGGIYQALAQGTSQQITSMVMATVVQPIFTAMASGIPISQAVSSAAMQKSIADAKGYAAQLQAVFANEEFRSFMQELNSMFMDIGKSIGGASSPVISYGSAAVSKYNAAAEAAKRAAEETKRAWQGVADSLTEEIRRIRGEILGNRDEGQAYYQAQFAMATARARAGDQEAAKLLPELSRKLLEIAGETAGSLGDLRGAQGATMASLIETRRILAQRYGLQIPAFASGGLHYGGVRLVGERGPEIEATGPARYFNATQTASMLAGGSNAALVAEVKALREQVRDLTSVSMVTANNTTRLDNNIDRVTSKGNAMRTVEVD